MQKELEEEKNQWKKKNKDYYQKIVMIMFLMIKMRANKKLPLNI